MSNKDFDIKFLQSQVARLIWISRYQRIRTCPECKHRTIQVELDHISETWECLVCGSTLKDGIVKV